MSQEQKEFAHKTLVKYAPHPYIWIKNCKALPTGIGLYSDQLELSREELPPIDDALIKIYPMVWKNKYTGKFSLQMHGCCVEDLIVDGVPIGNLVEVRKIVYNLMRPGIDPSRVYTHEWQEGDLAVFCNRSLWHTVVGSLKENDIRVFHQCNLVGSEAPIPADPFNKDENESNKRFKTV